MKQNEKAISFFKLKMSELPALAIYQTLDDKWDTLPITEVLLEQVQNFCDGFLKGKVQVSKKLQVKQVEVFFPLSSVQFRCSVMSDSLQPHRLQNARLPCPSPTPGACSNSCPSIRSIFPLSPFNFLLNKNSLTSAGFD